MVNVDKFMHNLLADLKFVKENPDVECMHFADDQTKCLAVILAALKAAESRRGIKEDTNIRFEMQCLNGAKKVMGYVEAEATYAKEVDK